MLVFFLFKILKGKSYSHFKADQVRQIRLPILGLYLVTLGSVCGKGHAFNPYMHFPCAVMPWLHV